MKRTLTLIIAGSLTAVVGITVVVLTLSAITSPTPASAEQPVQSLIPSTDQVDVEAMAQAIQLEKRQAELETVFGAREAALQTQIAQAQQALTELDQTGQAQLTRLQAQLSDLQAQIEQSTASIQSTQNHAGELQQAIQTDAAAYENELASVQADMTQLEQQFQQQIEVATAQLLMAYNEIAARQALVAAAVQSGDSGGGGDRHEDRDDDDHDDDHDDRDDDHDDHDDDD